MIRQPKVVTEKELVSEDWRAMHPNNCPVKLRDGDGKSVGPCWYFLKDGICPAHGAIYSKDQA